MPLLIVCTRILSGRLHHRFNLVQEQFSLLTEFARATLVSIRLIKAYTLERFQEAAVPRPWASTMCRATSRWRPSRGCSFPSPPWSAISACCCCSITAALWSSTARITIGSFVAFVSYLYMLIWPMMAVGWVANLAQRGITSLRRIHHLLDQQPVVSTGPTLALPQTATTSYVCRHLSFTYGAAVRPALTDLNLEIGPGLVGMAGRTGSGKSTLCKLLLRMYPVADGRLFFRGMDVNRLSQADVRGMHRLCRPGTGGFCRHHCRQYCPGAA